MLCESLIVVSAVWEAIAVERGFTFMSNSHSDSGPRCFALGATATPPLNESGSKSKHRNFGNVSQPCQSLYYQHQHQHPHPLPFHKPKLDKMASVVIRSILGPSIAPWSRIPLSAPRFPVSSSFVTSSRKGLEASRSIRAEDGAGTLGEAFPELLEEQEDNDSSTAAPSLSSSPGASSQQMTPAISPLIDSITAASTHASASDASATAKKATAPSVSSGITPTAPTSTISSPPTATALSRVPQFNLTSPTRKPSSYRWSPEPSLISPDPSRRSPTDNSPTHTLTVTSTRNNVLLTFSDSLGPVFPTITGGSHKTFKKAGRASFESAHQATVKVISKIIDFAAERPRSAEISLRVAFRGVFGQGREAVAAALGGPDGNEMRRLIKRLEDRTPLKIGGTRARKPRRL